MSLSDELRDVHGLHAFSLLFGYDLEGDTDWTWHDVACAMADRVDAEVAEEKEENGWAREFLNRMGRKCGTKDCPSLVAYVDKLEAENAKLRDERDCLFKACTEKNNDLLTLVVENRQLRELVADMWDWTRGCETCDEHEPHERYCLGHECRKRGRVIERMRALGMEVDA